MAAKICVLGLILFSYPYMRSAMVRFPQCKVGTVGKVGKVGIVGKVVKEGKVKKKSKWFELAQNGLKWLEMASNGSKWL